MKKSLAMLLSILMVISTITCMFTVTVAHAETIPGELLSNGDFEDITLSPVGTNMDSIKFVKDPYTLLNGKWLRMTGGLSYATYGDLIDYNEETDEITKATETDYAKYFTACSTVVVQPDNQTNHLGRINQTLLQAFRFNDDEGTFTFKAKVKGNENTTKFTIGFSGLQTEDGVQLVDYAYNKYKLEVIDSAGNFTYTYASSDNQIYVHLKNPTEWTDVELVFKATKNVDPAPTRENFSIVDVDFTVLNLYHDSTSLSSGDNGKNYRKNGMYIDDVSLKHYADPIGEAEFYKNGEKIENCNEYGGAKFTVDGKEVLAAGLGDTVVATADYNKDANKFAGWFKGDELITRDETITFTANSIDIYTPKFVSKNILEDKAGSFENFEKATSLVVKDNTKYPENGEWGSNKNAGYYGATYAETIYDVNGNAYMQAATGSTENIATNAAVVDDAKAYSGSNSLKINCGYRTIVMGMDVKPNTNYTLSYYINGIDADNQVVSKTGVVTTLNIGNGATPTAADGNTKPLSGMSKTYVSAFNDAYALDKNIRDDKNPLVNDEWTKMTLTFNSGNFEKLYFAVAPHNTETFWVDELCLTAEEEAETVSVKFVNTDGVALDDASAANIYAKASVTEDFDGSYLLDLDFEKESGAYTFIGWYDANNNLLSKEEFYDYDGDLESVYAKILSRNILEGSASFEGYENNTSLQVTDNTKYPDANEWGLTKNAGYYGATYEEVIYDKYGYPYQQYNSGTPEKIGSSKMVTSTDAAYKGNTSLRFTFGSRPMVSGLVVEPNTNYTLTYFIKSASDISLKYMGVATTVNLNQKVTTVTPIDNSPNASGFIDAIGNFPNIVAIAKDRDIALTNSEWKKVTYTFNSGNFEKLYLCICPQSTNPDCYIDELSLVPEEKPEFIDVKIVDKNGEAVSEEIAKNASVEAFVEKDIYTGTKTAIVNYEIGAYTFFGWYNADDTLISTDKEFVVTGSLEGLYAKVQNNNLLTYAASYEIYENGANLKYTGADYPSGVYFGGNKNDGYLGQTFEETIYDNKGEAIEQTAGGTASDNSVNAIISNAKSHSGDKSIELKNNWWTASMGIDVKPNTDYVLSYWILAPKQEGLQNTIALSAIATTVNTGAKGSGSTAALNQATNLYLDSKALTTVHDGKNWIKVTHVFNSMNLNKVYLVIGQTVYNATGNINSWSYIDDMTMFETKPTTMNFDMKSCASIAPINGDLNAFYLDQEFIFKVIDNMDTDAVVTFNGETVVPDADGIYTVYLGEENTLSVRFDGDENLPNYDEDEFGRKLNVNNLDVYSEPVWEGDTVYHETALFTPDKDIVKLLYPVDEIVSLRSYDLRTNYIEGYDFEITEDGMIKRLEGGRIPVWATSLVTDTEGDWKTKDDRYVVLTGDTTYPKYAISVTYKHSTTFAEGYTPVAPESQYAYINNVMTKLEKGEEVNIVVYGDSISCGWSSSGMNPDIKIYDETNTEGNYITRYNINVAPFAPTWIQMLEAKLKELYPDATINFKNLSLGGKTAPWGAENIAKRLALWKDEEGNQVVPDLILTGFGVNDCNNFINRVNKGEAITQEQAVATFKTNMKAIVDTAREVTGNANMEAIYYSPMFPNQNAIYWPAEILLAYENAMVEIAADDNNIGLLKLSSIFNEIVKNKDAEDYLNTNLNHGNDFTARLYYNGLLAAMAKDENAKETPDTPDAPAAESIEATKVVLTATEGYEYSMDGVVWQTSNVFEGLAENTEYTFYQRVAETEAAYASEASDALTITTPAVYVGITGDANGDEVVNLKDLIALARFVAKWDIEINEAVMDFDKDGDVDLADVTYLARGLAGWSDSPLA